MEKSTVKPSKKVIVQELEVPMIKPLLMYFRVKEVKKNRFQMIDYDKRVSNPLYNVSPHGGVVIVAEFVEHPILGKLLAWGGSLCLPSDLFNKKKGYGHALEYALENFPYYATKIVSYAKGKQIAEFLANEIWKQRGLVKPFQRIFPKGLLEKFPNL